MDFIISQIRTDGMLIVLALFHTAVITSIAISLHKIAKNTKK